MNNGLSVSETDYKIIAETLEKQFEQLKEVHERMSIKKHEYHQKYLNLKQFIEELMKGRDEFDNIIVPIPDLKQIMKTTLHSNGLRGNET